MAMEMSPRTNRIGQPVLLDVGLDVFGLSPVMGDPQDHKPPILVLPIQLFQKRVGALTVRTPGLKEGHQHDLPFQAGRLDDLAIPGGQYEVGGGLRSPPSSAAARPRRSCHGERGQSPTKSQKTIDSATTSTSDRPSDRSRAGVRRAGRDSVIGEERGLTLHRLPARKGPRSRPYGLS